MRSLIQFFINYHAFFFFLILEVLCVVLIVQNNNYHRTNIVNSTNLVSGTVYSAFSEVGSYFTLRKINQQLAEENAELRAGKGKIVIQHPGFSKSDNDYNFLAARVINNTTRNTNNYLTLNKGSNDGVDVRMGVICKNGVVGIVKDVSSHFSSVLSVLHRNTRISSKLTGSGTIGSVSWEGRSPYHGVLSEIPQHVDVSVGDTVVTSGFSSIFSPDIPVGFVEEITPKPGSDFYNITIRLAASFDDISFVTVVNHELTKEKENLEEEESDE